MSRAGAGSQVTLNRKCDPWSVTETTLKLPSRPGSGFQLPQDNPPPLNAPVIELHDSVSLSVFSEQHRSTSVTGRVVTAPCHGRVCAGPVTTQEFEECEALRRIRNCYARDVRGLLRHAKHSRPFGQLAHAIKEHAGTTIDARNQNTLQLR
jgi:hypothetical protein